MTEPVAEHYNEFANNYVSFNNESQMQKAPAL